MRKKDLDYLLRTPIVAVDWGGLISDYIDIDENGFPKQPLVQQAPENTTFNTEVKQEKLPSEEKAQEPVLIQESPAEKPQETKTEVPLEKKPVKKKPRKKAPGKNLPSEEHVPVEELIEQSPELQVLNEFMPEIFTGLEEGSKLSPFNPFEESDPKHIDLSLNVCKLLHDYGYMAAWFQLGPEYDPDNCDKGEGSGFGKCWEIEGFSFDFSYLIDNAHIDAAQKGYYPPKPIIALTHPGCACSLKGVSPVSAEAIPDSAPGLPWSVKSKQLIKYKEELYSTLKDIIFDRFTTLQIASSGMKASSFIKNTEWKEKRAEFKKNVKPVKIIKNYLYQVGLGLVRPIPREYFGFLLEESSDNSNIYLSNMDRVVEIPNDYFTEIFLEETGSKESNDVSYVLSNGNIGILMYLFPDKTAYVYFPHIEKKLVVSDWMILEH